MATPRYVKLKDNWHSYGQDATFTLPKGSVGVYDSERNGWVFDKQPADENQPFLANNGGVCTLSTFEYFQGPDPNECNDPQEFANWDKHFVRILKAQNWIDVTLSKMALHSEESARLTNKRLSL